jgi:predicted O-methyltransferase YrrM
VERVTERALFLHKHILSDAVSPYRNQPWPLITAIESFSDENDIPMLISKAKMEVVRDVLAGMDPKPKVIVEFGAYVGSSAVGWGAILKELHGGNAEGLKVFAFELDPKIAQVATDMVKLAGLDDIVTIMDGPGSESLKKLVSEGQIEQGGLDMAFVDHWKDFYVPDLKLCEDLKVFHLGSLAIADNTDYPGAPEYVKYVKGGGSGVPGGVRYESESITVHREAKRVRRFLSFV